MTPLVARPPGAAQACWTGLWMDQDAAGSAPALMQWERLEDLPTCKELILVVPAAMLSWHQVALPKLPAHRWRPALAGLLEERLLTDTDDVHLALAPGAHAGQDVVVAACDRRWLAQVLQSLEAAGRPVSRIVPEFEPGPQRLHLLGQPEQGWLVECEADRVSCLPLGHPARDMLQAWRDLAVGGGAVSAEPALAALAEQVWGQAPQLAQAGQHLRTAAHSPWDLAQFELTPRRGWLKRLLRLASAWLTAPRWRPARWGAAALLVLQLAGLQAWAWKEGRQLQALREELKAVLTSTFPHVKLVIDPVRQMERETSLLAQARGQASAGNLAHMLAALASLGAPAPGQGSLEFRNGELTLAGWTLEPERLPGVQALLARQGYQLQAQGQGWVLRTSSRGEAP